MSIPANHPAIVQARERGLIRERGDPTVSSVSVIIHVRTPNYSNVRAHHFARNRQVQKQYGAVWAALFDVPTSTREELSRGCVVSMTRITPGKPDPDGLKTALKSIRDGVAVWLLGEAPGRMDADPRITWAEPAQELGKKGVHAVRLEIKPRG